MTCLDCPYLHAADEPCPPEWTDVPTGGKGKLRVRWTAWQVATWVVLALCLWAFIWSVLAAVFE